MPDIILTAVQPGYSFTKITMHVIKINLYFKNKQKPFISKQVILQYHEKP